MSLDVIIRIISETLMIAIVVSGPTVLTAAAVGLMVSVLQAATQVQESTIASVAKIVAVFGVLAIAGLWMLKQLVQFAVSMFELIPSIGS